MSLSVSQLSGQLGATCGATFVDREFNKYLKTIFEDWEQNELGNGGNNVANRIEVGLLYEFEPIKRAFGSNALTSFAFSAAGLTRLDTDYAAQKVRQGTLDITRYVVSFQVLGHDLVTTDLSLPTSRADLVLMFRRSVEKTIELIQHQVGMAETEKTHVTVRL
jgi:hypothetical protein